MAEKIASLSIITVGFALMGSITGRSAKIALGTSVLFILSGWTGIILVGTAALCVLSGCTGIILEKEHTITLYLLLIAIGSTSLAFALLPK